MKKKSTYRKRNKRYSAKMKAILATSKKAFTKPKGGANSEYVIFEENTERYYADYNDGKSGPCVNMVGRCFWLTKNISLAVKFSKNSIGINDVIPLMKKGGAWRIIKIKI